VSKLHALFFIRSSLLPQHSSSSSKISSSSPLNSSLSIFINSESGLNKLNEFFLSNDSLVQILSQSSGGGLSELFLQFSELNVGVLESYNLGLSLFSQVSDKRPNIVGHTSLVLERKSHNSSFPVFQLVLNFPKLRTLLVGVSKSSLQSFNVLGGSSHVVLQLSSHLGSLFLDCAWFLWSDFN